jgi:hypothetical protein
MVKKRHKLTTRLKIESSAAIDLHNEIVLESIAGIYISPRHLQQKVRRNDHIF